MNDFTRARLILEHAEANIRGLMAEHAELRAMIQELLDQGYAGMVAEPHSRLYLEAQALLAGRIGGFDHLAVDWLADLCEHEVMGTAPKS